MNIQGVTILRDSEADQALEMTRGGSRYHYDFDEAFTRAGWEQYDTEQDASYFGVWVKADERKVFTYAEGDRILEIADTQEEFVALLQRMTNFYGVVPPVAVGFDGNGRTDFYAPRPGDSLLAQVA
ncbi:hypothetical protein GALL_461870 [mine drainage metagenome]|uniref:Uncharacterized protein n=1 Tax=mine drainage metagenome TaxID=410659 RepID=A0A1J5PWI7_9ZZZZ